MEIPNDSMLLRIFIGESDRWGHQPLYEAIVMKAREMHMAGATVLRGPMGFGQSARIHNANILDLSANLPLVIEIVDAEDKLRAFADEIAGLKDIGLVTLEKVEVLHYGHAAGG